MAQIQADEGFLIKAYLIDIDPFCRGGVRRVVIDEHGMVFIPTYGWVALQSSYHIVRLPGQFKKPKRAPLYHIDGGGWSRWGEWWSHKAWADPMWSWCWFRRHKLPDFHVCQVIDGAIFAG